MLNPKAKSMLEAKNILHFHAGCVDGVVSARILMDGTNNEYFDAVIPTQYDIPVPEYNGRSLTFVDFSPRRDDVLRLLADGNEVIILDHHLTTLTEVLSSEEIINHPNFRAIFSTEVSGVGVAHIYLNSRKLDTVKYTEVKGYDPENKLCFKGFYQPEVIRALNGFLNGNIGPRAHKLLSDYDSGRYLFNCPPQYLTAYLRVTPAVIQNNPTILPHLEDVSTVNELIEQGEICLIAQKQNILKQEHNLVRFDTWQGTFGVINFPTLDADAVADAFFNNLKSGLIFIVLFQHQRDGKIKVSMRGNNHLNSVDLSQVAKNLTMQGGGGHYNAASCFIQSEFVDIEVLGNLIQSTIKALNV